MSEAEAQHASEISEPSGSSVPTGVKTRVISMTPDDIPHVYQYSVVQGSPGIQCMVCKENINIKGKERQYVVRCEHCNEATPIRMPPGDKKYVRCVCGCLLICRTGALRIICPRQDCHKILDIGHSQAASESSARVEGMVRVACVFCDRNFLFNTLEKKLARCPHCSKRSAVGKSFACRCGLAYLFVSLLLVIVTAITIVFTIQLAEKQIGFYAIYACLFLVAILLFLRALYYFLMPVSVVLGPF